MICVRGLQRARDKRDEAHSATRDARWTENPQNRCAQCLFFWLFPGPFHWSSSVLHWVQPDKRSSWFVSTSENPGQRRDKSRGHKVNIPPSGRQACYLSGRSSSALNKTTRFSHYSLTLLLRTPSRSYFHVLQIQLSSLCLTDTGYSTQYWSVKLTNKVARIFRV